jgi:hypothetical protein
MTTKPPTSPPPDSLDAADTTATVLKSTRRMSIAEVEALNETWRNVVLADDEDAKALTRRIVARLRRASHEELHPDCPRVVVDVPPIPAGSLKVPVLLNGKEYIGRVEMWRCEAQTILGLVDRAIAVEGARLRDDGKTIDLDREGIAARVRAIQSA